MKENTDCTFLLSSYDGGEDLWEGFFTALKIQWPEMDMPIVLNTETKSYTFPGFDIKTYGLCTKCKMPWAKRLKETLKRIDTNYVLLFLEDYWLDDRVDDAYFRSSLEWLKANKDISTISYYPCMPGMNIQDGAFDRMELRPQKCEYKLNCQVALWRREKLIAYLRNHENPWEWEVWGSIRAGRYKGRFYTLQEGAKPVFSYGDPNVGCLVHRGKWVKDVAVPLCAKYNLKVDFSIRGFENFEKKSTGDNVEKTLIEKLQQPDAVEKIKQMLVDYFRKFKSMI